MSIRPPRPDTHRRCFAPCPVGTFCQCEGTIVGHLFGIDILANPTVPDGKMITTMTPPTGAALNNKDEDNG